MTIVKKLFIIILLNLIVMQVLCQDDQASGSLKLFSADRLFKEHLLDPFAAYNKGSASFITGKSDSLSGMINQVSIGFSQSILRWSTRNKDFELGLETFAYNVFNVTKVEDQDKLLGGLMTTDYRVGGFFNYAGESISFKIRFFHNSSHTGDDYMIRNDITGPNDRSANYEQMDITLAKDAGIAEFYSGAGIIISRHVYRKRFSLWGGGRLDNPIKGSGISVFQAFNLRLLQEYDFSPDICVAAGISLDRFPESSLIPEIWIEYYNGHLPYGTVRKGRNSWIGLGAALMR